MTYDPKDWYWVADDGRIFSSRAQSSVGEDDAEFVSWSENRVPTPWPRDDAGEQTDAALNAVLAPYGSSVSGALPAKMSFLQFMDLFTEAEQLAIAGAAMTDAATKLWYDRAVGAQFIDLGDERLVAGLQKIVDANLLTATRRNRILNGLAPGCFARA